MTYQLYQQRPNHNSIFQSNDINSKASYLFERHHLNLFTLFNLLLIFLIIFFVSYDACAKSCEALSRLDNQMIRIELFSYFQKLFISFYLGKTIGDLIESKLTTNLTGVDFIFQESWAFRGNVADIKFLMNLVKGFSLWVW